jgi:hypothetical protein
MATTLLNESDPLKRCFVRFRFCGLTQAGSASVTFGSAGILACRQDVCATFSAITEALPKPKVWA